MPPQSSRFKTSNLSRIWTTLTRSMRDDPTLRACVDSWCLFDGSDDDLMEPSEADCPHLRLEPVAGSGGWYDENSHMLNVPIKLTLGVTGTDFTAILDFWDAVRVALFTGNTLLNKLSPYGLVSKTLTVPAVGVATWGEASGLSAVGMLLLKIRVDS
jgi:hypothetical protein